MRETLKAVLSAHDLVAVLGREVPVRVVDISTSGCLLESESRLDAGVMGTLRVSYDGQQYVDDVRVMRCNTCEGASGLYQMGAAFLWTTRPDHKSLRRVINWLNRAAVRREDATRRT